jgi:hypothetical protein
LSGVYTGDEMEQTVDQDTGEITPAPQPTHPPATGMAKFIDDNALPVQTVTVKVAGIVNRQLKDGVKEKFVITADDHTQYHTFSITVAQTAKDAKEAGVAVEIRYTDTKYGRMVQSLREAHRDEPEPVL